MNPITGLRLGIYNCDDFLVRGSGPESAKFHTALELSLPVLNNTEKMLKKVFCFHIYRFNHKKYY